MNRVWLINWRPLSHHIPMNTFILSLNPVQTFWSISAPSSRWDLFIVDRLYLMYENGIPHLGSRFCRGRENETACKRQSGRCSHANRGIRWFVVDISPLWWRQRSRKGKEVLEIVQVDLTFVMSHSQLWLFFLKESPSLAESNMENLSSKEIHGFLHCLPAPPTLPGDCVFPLCLHIPMRLPVYNMLLQQSWLHVYVHYFKAAPALWSRLQAAATVDPSCTGGCLFPAVLKIVASNWTLTVSSKT